MIISRAGAGGGASPKPRACALLDRAKTHTVGLLLLSWPGVIIIQFLAAGEVKMCVW